MNIKNQQKKPKSIEARIHSQRRSSKWKDATNISAVIEPDKKHQLKKIVAEKDITISELVRVLIDDYLDTVKDKKN